MQRTAGRFAACTVASLAALPCLQKQRRQPLCRGRQQPVCVWCEVLVPAERHWQLNREAFISGREFMDVHSLYSFRDSIGEGGFGKVFQATHKRTGIMRAIKVIPKRDNVEDIKNEIKALSELDHPNIVRLIEYFEDASRFYLVQALCDGPDLAEMLSEATGGKSRYGERNGPLPERDVSIVIRDCLKSIIGCHAHGFVHRDIKLDNFMVTGREGVVKMIDFGLVVRCNPEEELALTEAAGTSIYRAPEMMVPSWRRARTPEGENFSFPAGPEGASSTTHSGSSAASGYDSAVDVWSLGVVLFALLSGESLFKRTLDARSVRDRLKDPKFVQDRLRHCQALKFCSPEARELLEQMLRHDPSERISTAEALRHPFVQRHRHETLRVPPASLPLTAGSSGPVLVDPALPEKLAAFARLPRLRQMATLAMTHLFTEQSETIDALRPLRRMFRTLDEDGDGQLSLEELQRAGDYGVSMTEDLETLFRACDLNGTGRLNFVEFFACCLPPGTFTEKLCTEAFVLLDRNFSGQLDAQDLSLLFRRRQSAGGGGSGAAASDCPEEEKRLLAEYEAIIGEAELALRGPGTSLKGCLSLQDFHLFVRGCAPQEQEV